VQREQGSGRALTARPDREKKRKKENDSNLKLTNQIYSKLIHSKSDFLRLKIFEIKYGCE
jgi:hypothetical protein